MLRRRQLLRCLQVHQRRRRLRHWRPMRRWNLLRLQQLQRVEIWLLWRLLHHNWEEVDLHRLDGHKVNGPGKIDICALIIKANCIFCKIYCHGRIPFLTCPTFPAHFLRGDKAFNYYIKSRHMIILNRCIRYIKSRFFFIWSSHIKFLQCIRILT